MNLKKIIEDSVKNKEYTNIEKLLLPARTGFGDFGLPCFSYSKQFKKSPIEIALDIQASVDSPYVEKTEVVNGYLNFYLNKLQIIKDVLLNNIETKTEENKGKVMCIDYSSVNLAKYMHIGHLATTMIGESIARIYEATGYNVVRINYIGDYGTPFGKIITAYKLWGNEEDVNKRGIDALQELYVKFCSLEDSDPNLIVMARDEFRKIEEQEPTTYAIYKKIFEVAKDAVKDLTSMLGIKFDDWNGESYYSDKMQPTVDELKAKNLVKISEGALICDLQDYNLGVCIIQKNDGTSLYATRDITAAEDRYNKYHFDESIYVTAVQQKQHFASFFKVIDLMDKPFKDKIKHVYYGMFSLPDGKIASRRGKQAIVRDILTDALEKAESVIKDRDFNEEERKEVTKAVAMGAVVFSVLKNERIKDSVFDLEKALSFDGETAPYMQYTYARCMSILRNAKNLDLDNVDYDFECLNNEIAFEIVKALNNYITVVKTAKEKYEPSIISKYTLDLCSLVNKYYHESKIIIPTNLAETKTKLLLIEKTKEIIKSGLNLIVIDTVDKM
ncbi:MAG: arginine--tRNA ligase [Clostridia bacterium]|nr:arginine--tRNA ligase [Clostridia bacterium]